MRLSRRALLGAAGAAGVVGLRAHGEPPPVRLVVVHAAGGWDPSFTIDPKPGTAFGPYPDLDPDDPDDVEVVASWGDVRVSVNEARRPGVTRFFEAYGDRVAVVNGLWVGSLSHWQATVRVLTGTVSEASPDVSVVAGVTAGRDRPVAAVDLSGVSRTGPFAPLCARTGVRGQLRALLDPASRYPLADGAARPSFAPTEADRDAIGAWLAARAEPELFDPARVAWHLDRREALDRAERLRDDPELLGLLPDGRRTDLRDDVALAAALLAGGTCHAVLLSSGQHWDTHAGAAEQHASWSALGYGLRDLGDALATAGMLDRTLVAVLSEFGRTPARNAEDGTDHWPYTSALLFGAGVLGGTRLGATDDGLVGAGEPARYDQLAAGILAAVGVDPEPWLPGVAPLRGFASSG